MKPNDTPTVPTLPRNIDRLLTALSQDPSLLELRSIPIFSLILPKPSAPQFNMACDISLPPIVLSAPPYFHLLTGHDQLSKARILGFTTIDCLVVSPKVYARFAESVEDGGGNG